MPKLAVSSARWRWPYTVAAVLLLPTLCMATDLRLVAVTPGQSADVVIDHGAPVTIEVGETIEGVKLLRVDRASAVLTVNGITRTLPLVADVGTFSDTIGGSATLVADARGQFFTTGTVNGRPIHFIVDTGATLTTLSRADAQRIGLEYRGGTPMRTSTANGVVNGWRVSLASVSVGDMTVRGVDAMVVDNDSLPVALLGMSFLDRFDMHRQGSTLVLRRRR
jgi:aspartyl protease family protein